MLSNASLAHRGRYVTPFHVRNPCHQSNVLRTWCVLYMADALKPMNSWVASIPTPVRGQVRGCRRQSLVLLRAPHGPRPRRVVHVLERYAHHEVVAVPQAHAPSAIHLQDGRGPPAPQQLHRAPRCKHIVARRRERERARPTAAPLRPIHHQSIPLLAAG